MKRSRKILALLLSLVLLLSLGGCTQNIMGQYTFFSAPPFCLEASKRTHDAPVPVDFTNALPALENFYEMYDELNTPVALLRAPVGYKTVACSLMPYHSVYLFHPHSCSAMARCDCTRGLEVMISYGKSGLIENVWFSVKDLSELWLVPQVLATADHAMISDVLDVGENVFSPFCLPMIPIRLLRILLKELVKAAFAFGIGWLLVLFAKRRKKSTPAK